MRLKICSICRRKLPFKAFTIIENGYNTDGLTKNQLRKEIVCKQCESQPEYRELITVKKTTKLISKSGKLLHKKDVSILDMNRDFFYLIANANYTKVTKGKLEELLKRGVVDVYNSYIVVAEENYKYTKAKMEKEKMKKAQKFVRSFKNKNELFKDSSILKEGKDGYLLFIEEGGNFIELTWTQIERLIKEDLIECYNDYIVKLKGYRYQEVKKLIA